MWPDVVVVIAPEGQRLAGVGEGIEDLFIQAFVAQAAVEAFDQTVLLRMRRIRKQSGPNRPGFAGGHFCQAMRPWLARPAWRSSVPRLQRVGYCRLAPVVGDG